MEKQFPSIGDAVAIRGVVVETDGECVMVETEPADLPGSTGYRQRIRLHAAQLVREETPSAR